MKKILIVILLLLPLTACGKEKAEKDYSTAYDEIKLGDSIDDLRNTYGDPFEIIEGKAARDEVIKQEAMLKDHRSWMPDEFEDEQGNVEKITVEMYDDALKQANISYRDRRLEVWHYGSKADVTPIFVNHQEVIFLPDIDHYRK